MPKIFHSIEDKKPDLLKEGSGKLELALETLTRRLLKLPKPEFENYLKYGSSDSANKNTSFFNKKMMEFCKEKPHSKQMSIQDQLFLGIGYSVIKVIRKTQNAENPQENIKNICKKELREFLNLRNSSKKQTLIKNSTGLDSAEYNDVFKKLSIRRERINTALTTAGVLGSVAIAAGAVVVIASGVNPSIPNGDLAEFDLTQLSGGFSQNKLEVSANINSILEEVSKKVVFENKKTQEESPKTSVNPTFTASLINQKNVLDANR